MNAVNIPPITNEDRLPDDRAVWRDGRPSVDVPANVQVSVDYGNGLIERTVVGEANWLLVQRYRFGWEPERRAAA